MTNRLMREAGRVLADLEIKAAMFDMDVDIEALTLVPKSKYQEPVWITRWREKEANSDRQPEDYEGGEDER